MKKMQHRRQWSAWILLAVFVPMVLMSSLHHHESNGTAEVSCYECLHHIHHAGHLTAGQESIDHCVLCQFLSLSFFAAVAFVLGIWVQPVFMIHSFPVSIRILEHAGKPSPRAPPFVL